MNHPYKPPLSNVADFAKPSRRLSHSLAAFAAGMVAPPLVILALARLIFGQYATGFGNSALWGSTVFGSLLAAGAVYRFKRMPLWLAAVIGPVTVFVLMVAPSIWRLWLSQGAT